MSYNLLYRLESTDCSVGAICSQLFYLRQFTFGAQDLEGFAAPSADQGLRCRRYELVLTSGGALHLPVSADFDGACLLTLARILCRCSAGHDFACHSCRQRSDKTLTGAADTCKSTIAHP